MHGCVGHGLRHRASGRMGAKAARCCLSVRGVFPVFFGDDEMKQKLARLAQLSRNNAARAVVAITTLPVAMAARAQSTDPFDAAVDQVTTKVGTYGAALVGVAAAAVVFMVAIKYVKKIPRAS